MGPAVRTCDSASMMTMVRSVQTCALKLRDFPSTDSGAECDQGTEKGPYFFPFLPPPCFLPLQEVSAPGLLWPGFRA